MKHTIAILIAVLCLTSACRGGQTTSPQPLTQAAVDSAAIYQEKAYQAMFDNVLHQAEQHAYRAFLSFPSIEPGVHLGIALTTRKASSSKSGCTLLTTLASVILPSISTINVTITRP